MEIKLADWSDAPIIHEIMIKAFTEYKEEAAPSSALEETAQAVSISLKDGEKSFICYSSGQPVGTVRFRLNEEHLYFFRLAVAPEMQGRGIAKKLLKALEDYAIKEEIVTLRCKVRMAVPRNINLYRSVGYAIVAEEIVQKPNGVDVKVATMVKKLG
ncbi:GNAT family N-acetyltransferase [Robertmurraya yapensis]|uniref:GNAT family N-acetyltransferase n=1 Tax=Bacillus yapensis TaxID=2492960 RepID=A0A3S0KCR1_9BACI|nr:GNAT family N-acetyltransferase [Bacillus yapensis]RTR27835.1 GNAT family N-acetyltransferase [Bacillus yapensis]TKS94238.1 GNAT family N-acetyltransferase [Bacillus yapensis]